MPANIGNQTVSILYHAAADSSIVNKRHKDIRRPGIYKGGYLSIIDSSNAQLSPLVCEIGDGTHQVKVETTIAVNIAVAQATPYIVLRWTYTGAQTDYMEILAVASPATCDLVVGRCSFTGEGDLQGFIYSERSTPSTHDLFLKVEPTESTELRVRIRAGRIQTVGGVIDISDQKSNLFVVPGSNSRIDLVYVDTNGTIKIDSSGTPAADPSPPSYKSRLVLAEVTLASTSTNITANMIKDVRNFLGPSDEPDGLTLEKGSDGKWRIKDGGVSQGKLGTITSILGNFTNKDSQGNLLKTNTTYKVTSDGFILYWDNTDDEWYRYFMGNSPTTLQQLTYLHMDDEASSAPFAIAIKNKYWRLKSWRNTVKAIWWFPVGNGQCIKQ